jgi:hypothetical protein
VCVCVCCVRVCVRVLWIWQHSSHINFDTYYRKWYLNEWTHVEIDITSTSCLLFLVNTRICTRNFILKGFYTPSQNFGTCLLASSYTPVSLSSWHNSTPIERFLMKFYILEFFENLSRKFKFHLDLARITGTSYEDLCTFMTVFLRILLTKRNIPDKTCRENQNTFCFQQSPPPRNPCRLWDNVKKCGTARQARDSNIIWHMRFPCWVTKTTNTR